MVFFFCFSLLLPFLSSSLLFFSFLSVFFFGVLHCIVLYVLHVVVDYTPAEPWAGELDRLRGYGVIISS